MEEKCFNLDNFISEKNQRLVKYLYNEQSKYNAIFDKEVSKNKEVFELYDLLIDRINKLLDSFNLDNPLECSFALNYLIALGLVSTGSVVKTDDNFLLKNNEFICNHGITIVRGFGCCRNFSDFFNDVLKRRMAIHNFYCYSNNIFNQKFTLRKDANHIINLIEFNGSSIGFDAIRNHIYRFINDRQARIVNDLFEDFLTYKPYLEIIRDNCSIADIRKKMEHFSQSSLDFHYTWNDFVDIESSVRKKIDSEKDVLESFDKDTREIRSDIKKKVLII